MTSLKKFELLLHVVVRESKINLSGQNNATDLSEQNYKTVRQLRWIWELNKEQIDDLFNKVDEALEYDLGNQ